MSRSIDRSTRGPAPRLGTLAALAAAASLGLAAPSLRADDAGYAPKEALGTMSGADIYGHICQGCHMPNAQGAAGAGYYPKLAGDPALVSWEYAAVTVLGGKHGMPAFGLPSGNAMFVVHLSDAQVADVVNYVRTHFGNHYKDLATADQVAKLPHPGRSHDEP